MQESAIKSIESANNKHDNNQDDEKDDEISNGDNHQDSDEESEGSDDTDDKDDGLCSECGYDEYEQEHEDEESNDDCACYCHNEKVDSNDNAENSVRSYKREWHEKVYRPAGFPEYEAVSYTWGDAADVFPITLGKTGAQTMVTRNCHTALQSLRLQTSGRLIWIDALCINQDDDSERTAQVRVMGRIYASSYRVVIYLGDETPSSRMLFDELALAERAPPTISEGKVVPNRPIPTQQLVAALNHLLDRKWFNRVWVLQEVANSLLATSPPVIVCGSDSAEVSTLTAFIYGYASHSRIVDRALPFSLRIYIEHLERYYGLFDLLLLTCSCEATDTRDKVFALRGLLPHYDVALDELINYGDGHELTLLKVARYLLASTAGVTILNVIDHPHQLAMPSWVPVWNAVPDLAAFTSTCITNPSRKNDLSAWSIRTHMCDCGKCTGDHATLQVRGFMGSVVNHVGIPFSFESSDDMREQLGVILWQLDSGINETNASIHPSLSGPFLQGKSV